MSAAMVRAVLCGLRRGVRIGLGIPGGPHDARCPATSAGTGQGRAQTPGTPPSDTRVIPGRQNAREGMG